MQAFLVLCDAAQHDQVTGKLSMLGGDWSIIGPQISPMTVVVLMRTSWEEAEKAKTFTLNLLDDDGEPVRHGPERRPIQYNGRLSLDPGNPLADDKVARMTDIHSNVMVSLGSLPLQPGHRYRWTFDVEGEEIASVQFAVRSAPEN
ncbi:DUF6941 family protein [Microbispora sp. H11081]|uniref:DUF6941 family protein n=1 Tax=Microbispora sp. H11081 TaxID=2729107 RepID=UPI0014737079|nr:hypothetical protein [Microbispora sp. H11081]